MKKKSDVFYDISYSFDNEYSDVLDREIMKHGKKISFIKYLYNKKMKIEDISCVDYVKDIQNLFFMIHDRKKYDRK